MVQHQPVFPMAKGRRYLEMRAALEPLYDKYGVDLVLQGHDHLYARSQKVAAGKRPHIDFRHAQWAVHSADSEAIAAEAVLKTPDVRP